MYIYTIQLGVYNLLMKLVRLLCVLCCAVLCCWCQFEDSQNIALIIETTSITNEQTTIITLKLKAIGLRDG